MSSHPHRETLMQQLLENMDAMKRGMAEHFQALMRDCPISRSQLELLFTIRHTQPVSFKQAAQLLYMTPGAVSQLAEGLEQGGFISRQADENDRRVQYLQVSPTGTRLLQRIEKHRNSLMRTIMHDLSDEELAAWLRVQQKMVKHFQSESTEPTKQETK